MRAHRLFTTLSLIFGIALHAQAQTSVRVNSLKIDNGKATTENPKVRLYNRVSGVATHYRAGTSPTLANASWRTYSSSPAFDLPPGEGQKRLYFQVRSRGPRGEARSNIVSDTIAFVEPLKIGIVINEGAETSTTRELRVRARRLSGDTPTEFRRGESAAKWSASCKGEGWIPFDQAPPLVSSPDPGEKVVFAQARTPEKCSRVTSATILYAPD